MHEDSAHWDVQLEDSHRLRLYKGTIHATGIEASAGSYIRPVTIEEGLAKSFTVKDLSPAKYGVYRNSISTPDVPGLA